MKVSKSYQSWKYDEAEAFEKNGKLYVAAEAPCPRCSGKGIIIARIENGQPIPIPVDGGICYQCLGRKVITKDIRLYTDKEYEQKEAAAERARLKKQKEYEEKMRAEAEVKRAKWLDENGFDSEGITYSYYLNNSYEVKDTLKADGFKFDSVLLWHAPQIPKGYEDKVVKINLTDAFEMSAWGEGHYIVGAKDKVASIIKAARPQRKIHSEWIGEIGDRIKDISVIITMIHGFQGHYNYCQIVKFEDKNNNILKWFTTVDLSKYSVGDKVILTGTIKDLIEKDEYEDNEKTTLLTRCKIK